MKRKWILIYSILVVTALVVLAAYSFKRLKRDMDSNTTHYQIITSQLGQYISNYLNREDTSLTDLKLKQEIESYLEKEDSIQVISLYNQQGASVINNRNKRIERIEQRGAQAEYQYSTILDKVRYTERQRVLETDKSEVLYLDLIFEKVATRELNKVLTIILITIGTLFLLTVAMILASGRGSASRSKKKKSQPLDFDNSEEEEVFTPFKEEGDSIDFSTDFASLDLTADSSESDLFPLEDGDGELSFDNIGFDEEESVSPDSEFSDEEIVPTDEEFSIGEGEDEFTIDDFASQEDETTVDSTEEEDKFTLDDFVPPGDEAVADSTEEETFSFSETTAADEEPSIEIEEEEEEDKFTLDDFAPQGDEAATDSTEEEAFSFSETTAADEEPPIEEEEASTPLSDEEPDILAENSLEPSEEVPAEGESSLFSPSGVAKKEFFQDRLSGEIERAIAFDNEMTVILFQSENSGQSTENYGAFIEELQKNFLFKDLIFEQEEGGRIAVIVPQQGMSQAIKRAESFITEYGEPFGLSAGISSKAGREVLDGSRLLEEANEALSQCAGNRKVLGFYPDVEKYNEIVAEGER